MATITIPPPEDNLGSNPQFPERYVYLMTYLLMCCGLRVGEILDLNSQSIDLEKRVLTIRSRKSQTTRHVPFSPELHEILSAYVRAQAHARLEAMKRLARLRRFRHKR